MASYLLLQRWAHSIRLLCVTLSIDGGDFTSTLGPVVYSFPKKALPLVTPFLLTAATIPAFGMRHKTTLLTVRSVPAFYSLVCFLVPPLGLWIKEIIFSYIYIYSRSIRNPQLSVWWEFFVVQQDLEVQIKIAC